MGHFFIFCNVFLLNFAFARKRGESEIVNGTCVDPSYLKHLETYSNSVFGCRNYRSEDRRVQCATCTTEAQCLAVNDCNWKSYGSCRSYDETIWWGLGIFTLVYVIVLLTFGAIQRWRRKINEQHETVFYWAREVRWVEGRVDIFKGESFRHSIIRNLTQYNPFLKILFWDDAHYISLYEATANWLFTFGYSAAASVEIWIEREDGRYQDGDIQASVILPFLTVTLPCLLLFGLSIAIEAMEKKIELTSEDETKEIWCSRLDGLYHTGLIAAACYFAYGAIDGISHLISPWYCTVFDTIWFWGWLIPQCMGITLTSLKFLCAWDHQRLGSTNCFIVFASNLFWKMKPITLSERQSKFLLDEKNIEEIENEDGTILRPLPQVWKELGVDLHPSYRWNASKQSTLSSPRLDSPKLTRDVTRHTFSRGMTPYGVTLICWCDDFGDPDGFCYSYLCCCCLEDEEIVDVDMESDLMSQSDDHIPNLALACEKYSNTYRIHEYDEHGEELTTEENKI